MLYKKYHRSYVRKFRKGTEFSYKTYRDVVRKEPYILIAWGIPIRLTGISYDLVLVYSDGKINYNIKIVEDVIQEIS